MEEVFKVIDIEKVIKNSDSRVFKSLPRFIVRIMTKIIRQDDINAVIYNNRTKTGVPFINDVLRDWKVKVDIKGNENIPPKGRFIFASNHPVGGLDALALYSMIYNYFPQVVSPTNELLNNIPNLKPVILGLNVFGKNTKEIAVKLDELFESDTQVMIFPAGEVSRRKRGQIFDPLWQKSFITMAIRHKRDVIPVHISGRNSDLFYRVANLRKFLGIKMYIETMLLPREMLKQRDSTFTITIGKVIPYQTFMPKLSHFEWAQRVKDIVYSLTVSLTNK